jgi:hypothetical protein
MVREIALIILVRESCNDINHGYINKTLNDMDTLLWSYL